MTDDGVGGVTIDASGDLGVTNVTATLPLSSTEGATPDISISQANTSTDGYLSQTDWDTFNGKFNVPTGTITDYLDGLGSPQPFPTIPNAQVNSDWNSSSGLSEILNKPTIPTATSDLTNDSGFITSADVPTLTSELTNDSGFITSGDIPSQVNADWNASSGVEEILNKPTLAAVATSGSYNDLINQPTIPPAQIQSDWNQANNAALDFIKNKPTIPTGSVESVGLTMPNAFLVTGSPITTSGTLAVTANGLTTQYIRGDGQLANFPTSSGGGSSVSYYLNGSVNQGTFAGSSYEQMSKAAILGGGTTFTRTNAQGNGLIAQFITDANDPSVLSIPAGNWNLELFFKASSSGGSPSYYVELLKYDTIGLTFTSIATDSATPEGITNGTTLDAYFTALAVPATTLAVTDRLALRVFVNTSGKTIELHTENGHLCQVITTLSTGLNSLNGLTAQVQNFAVGTSGTNFGISSATSTHTFNLPTASASNRGALSSADWSTFNGKQSALGFTPVTDARTISTTSPLTGGGDLTANRTFAIAKSTASVDGYLAATDFTTFAAKQAALVSGTNIKSINSVSLLGSGDITTTYKSTIDTATITGTTNQLVGSQLIAANSFAVGDIIKVLARYKKSTSLVNSTIRFYVNSTNNLSGTPILIGTYGLVGLYAQMERNLLIKSSTNTETFGNTSSFYIDSGTGNAFSNSSIDWTINQYIIFAAQQGVAGETTLLTGFLIEKK